MTQTMAERLIEQGIKQGIEQGIEQGIKAIEQGIEQGETQAKQEVVLKLLRFRFDSVPEPVANAIRLIRSPSRLDLLFERVLAAQTLDEIDLQNHVRAETRDEPPSDREEVEAMTQTMAERLIEQGIERAKQEVVLKLLRFRFDSVPEPVANAIRLIRSPSRLDLLFERVLAAQTLDEIDLQNHVRAETRDG